MRTQKDIEAYLDRMGRKFSAIEDQPGTLRLAPSDGQLPSIVIRVDTPIVVMRAWVGNAPAKDHVELYKSLLTLNAKTLVHTSFGLEGDRIVLTSALELENLDYNELEATLDEIEMTLVSQVPGLSELSKKD